MRFLIIILFICTSFNPSYSQSEWFSIDTKERSADKKFKQVFQIVNEDSNEFITFFQYYNFFVAYLHNAKGELVNTFSANALPKYKNNYIGSSINGDDYTLFFQNDFATKFSALTINFSTSGFEFQDNLKAIPNTESMLGSFEYKSHIYILTTIKKTSKLKTYKLNNHKEVIEKEFDFSDVKFTSPRGFEISLNYLLDGGYDSAKASLIENNEPGSLELSSKKNKLFLDGSTLILTNDTYDTSTTYLSINLEDGSSKHINFPNQSFNKKDRGSKSNSFVLDNTFFHLYATKESLNFSIYNVDSKDLIKSLKVTEDDSMAFKNSPIILEGGEFENYRELERTKQFLRKVSNSNAGIFVYKKDNAYVITIGSSKTIQQANQFAFIGGVFGGLAFGITTAILTPSYQSYTHTKSTRIECLFDTSFNSIDGLIPENGFDKIENYINNNSDIKFKFQSIFKINENYVLGYFEKESGLYKYIEIN